MVRLLKCYGYCNEKHPKENLIKLNLNKNSSNPGQNYCKSCYEKKIKDHNDREDLYKYLQESFNLNFPTGLMLRQIKDFRNNRGYSYKNIRFTLNYVFNIKKTHKPVTKFGIAIVPYFHDEMIEYFKRLKEKRDNFVIGSNNVRKVTLPPFETNDSYRNTKFINMEALLE